MRGKMLVLVQGHVAEELKVNKGSATTLLLQMVATRVLDQTEELLPVGYKTVQVCILLHLKVSKVREVLNRLRGKFLVSR